MADGHTVLSRCDKVSKEARMNEKGEISPKRHKKEDEKKTKTNKQTTTVVVMVVVVMVVVVVQLGSLG